MNKNDIYAISGRIMNSIARKDLSLSGAGVILVNTYSLALKDLYDFADTLPSPYKEQLNILIEKKESLPEYVLELSTPKQDPEPEEMSSIEPMFKNNEQALRHFTKEYADLGAKYGKTGDEFFLEAENSSIATDDYRQIRTLSNNIRMCKYLIGKGNK